MAAACQPRTTKLYDRTKEPLRRLKWRKSVCKAETVTLWRATGLCSEQTTVWLEGRMDERTKALFTDAERSAERVVGQLRMAVALSLGAVLAIAVVAHAHRD